MACLARLALSVEEASTSSRLKPYLAQAASPNTPMALPSSGLVRPSQAMWSSISVLPYLMPVREPLSRCGALVIDRSEEHTSELQSLMRISYAVFCLQKKTQNKHYQWHSLLK